MTWQAFELGFGLHSRIPLCCVLLYVSFGGHRLITVNRTRHALFGPAYAAFHYVPCTRCLLAFNPVRVHRCSRACWWKRAATHLTEEL